MVFTEHGRLWLGFYAPQHRATPAVSPRQGQSMSLMSALRRTGLGGVGQGKGMVGGMVGEGRGMVGGGKGMVGEWNGNGRGG